MSRIMKSSLLLLSTTIFSLTLLTSSIRAQEATETVPPTATVVATVQPPSDGGDGGVISPLPAETPTPQELLQSLWVALLASLAPVIGSPVVSSLVQFLKSLPITQLQNVSPKLINVIVALVVVAIVFLANVAGFRSQLDTAFQVIVAVVGITLTAKSSQVWYSSAAKDVALLGTDRKERPLG